MWQWREVRWMGVKGWNGQLWQERTGVSSIHSSNRRRKNGDGGIRAKLMVIFYSGSVWSVLSNSIITSLVGGGKEGGGRRRDSLCHGCKWSAKINWVVTSGAVVLTLQRDGEMEREKRKVLIRHFVFSSAISSITHPTLFKASISHSYTLQGDIIWKNILNRKS